jgi:rRNA pseudouridine-1189 N-methylase Emg1 (Nep1/Mra1 family)
LVLSRTAISHSETRRLADVEVSIWGRTLDAWTVVSRVLCWAEQAVLTAGKT